MCIYNNSFNKIALTPKPDHGFSLLELVLAIAIFAIGSIITGNLLIDANTATRQDLDKAQAAIIAREGIEAVTSIRDADFDCLVVSAGTHGLSNPTGFAWKLNPSSGTTDVNDTKFLRGISIVTNPAGLTTFTSTSTALLTSAVTWLNARNATDTVTLTTVLTNWRVSSTDGVQSECWP